MRKYVKAALFCIMLLPLVVSCKQLFTFSLGSSLARDNVTISKKTSLSELLELSYSKWGRTTSGAKAITNAIASKDPAAVLALSTEDKTTILDDAISATGASFDAIAEALKAYNSGLVTEAILVESIFASFDSSVDMTMIYTLLDDMNTNNTLTSLPADTVILASAVLLADAVAYYGANAVIGYLTTPALIPALPADINDQLTLITTIAGKFTADQTMFAGFDLLDLLNGGV